MKTLNTVVNFFKTQVAQRKEKKYVAEMTKKYPSTFLKWYKAQKDEEVVDYTRGCGYYITGGSYGIFRKQIKKGELMKSYMDGSKEGVWKLLNYKNYNDPHDMTEWSTWQLMYYTGVKAIKDCTFEEYLQLYTK